MAVAPWKRPLRRCRSEWPERGGYRPRWSAQTGAPFIRKEIGMEATSVVGAARGPWNKGKLTGQKPPLKLKGIWAIRIRLQLASRVRDLAMFNLAIDSKLRA